MALDVVNPSPAQQTGLPYGELRRGIVDKLLPPSGHHGEKDKGLGCEARKHRGEPDVVGEIQKRARKRGATALKREANYVRAGGSYNQNDGL